jgi:hypothetical protein
MLDLLTAVAVVVGLVVVAAYVVALVICSRR